MEKLQQLCSDNRHEKSENRNENNKSFREALLVPFNRPPITGDEQKFLLEALSHQKLSGDGAFSKRCQQWFEQQLECPKALLTPSGTAALEMAALLLDIKPGDDVIMPSFTFPSTANAFALRGARIVFVDIEPVTMNIDAALIEAAITPSTKAIVIVHYAGVACDLTQIAAIARQHGLYIVEDAAQAMMSRYQGKALGTFGHLAAYSFHETKNYSSGGEGGLLIINDDSFSQRAEILREKGTNRSQFIRNEVDKYTWVDIGSSFLMSELQAAYLWAQLMHVEAINNDRLQSWHYYYQQLAALEQVGCLERPQVPAHCQHNAHSFCIKLHNLAQRSACIDFLKQQGVCATFHYIPLHTAPASATFGYFHGEDKYTTQESERILRLPLFFGLTRHEQDTVVHALHEFFRSLPAHAL